VSQGAAFAFAPPGSRPGGPALRGAEPLASERELLSGPRSGPWVTTDAIRQFQPSWRVRECGRWVAWGQQQVQVRKGDAGWTFGHIHRCGSPWSCPTCAHVISLQRGSEVAHAVQWWRAKDMAAESDVVLLSLTLRHKSGDDLRELRRGLSRAWRSVEQSRHWRAMRAACGLQHHIRCQEVTHGDNGWHPHLHILIFCTRPQVAWVWRKALLKCWRHQVLRTLGEKCLPSKRRALDIRACDDETYITRMGLEVGSPAQKHAKDGHLTAMQLAHELANASGPQRDRLAALWREYATAMHGAHQLQWSQGLREALGVAKSDGEIVSAPEHPERPVLAEIPAETWRDMAKAKGIAPIAAVGCSVHGLPEATQLDALLRFFERLEGCHCRWRLIAGRFRLQWVPG